MILKPMWKKLRSLGETDKRGRSNLGDLIRQGKVSEKQLCDYLREYYRLMALKQNGGLPRELLEFFKKKMARWTDDMADKSDFQC